MPSGNSKFDKLIILELVSRYYLSMHYASLVPILVQYFLAKQELSLLPIILFFVTSPETRKLIDWPRLVDKIGEAGNFGLLECSAIWQLRDETRCVSAALIDSSKHRRDCSYMMVCPPPEIMPIWLRSPTYLGDKLVRTLLSTAFNARHILQWVKYTDLTMPEVIVRGYVSRYVNYMDPQSEINTCMGRAKILVQMAIKVAMSPAQVGFTKGDLLIVLDPQNPKVDGFGSGIHLGYNPNTSLVRHQRCLEWNDWVKENVSVWIR